MNLNIFSLLIFSTKHFSRTNNIFLKITIYDFVIYINFDYILYINNLSFYMKSVPLKNIKPGSSHNIKELNHETLKVVKNLN